MRKVKLNMNEEKKYKIIKKLVETDGNKKRTAYFGEEVQLDASPHMWFGNIITHLHIAIDDSSSQIISAYFDSQETLNGYYNIFYQILTKYGIPYKFKTDGRTVFEYKSKKSPSEEEDTFTQFSYACHQLRNVRRCLKILMSFLKKRNLIKYIFHQWLIRGSKNHMMHL